MSGETLSTLILLGSFLIMIFLRFRCLVLLSDGCAVLYHDGRPDGNRRHLG